MQTGRGGMGSHKHFFSGRGGPSPGTKMGITRDMNRRLDEQARLRKGRSKLNRQYGSVGELMRSERKGK